MNITQEEKNALVQFFGVMHAQAKQTDDMIVGSSTEINRVSPNISRQLENVLKANIAPHRQQTQAPIYAEPADVPYVLQDIQTLSLPETTSYEVVEKLDSNILEVLKEINLNLLRIAATLEKQHGSTKKAKYTKSS